MAKTVEQFGPFKVKAVERNQSGSPRGMRTGWTEFQIWKGRKIISRHESFYAASAEAKKAHSDLWSEMAQ